jgi:hypothetical protein
MPFKGPMASLRIVSVAVQYLSGKSVEKMAEELWWHGNSH